MSSYLLMSKAHHDLSDDKLRTDGSTPVGVYTLFQLFLLKMIIQAILPVGILYWQIANVHG